MGRRKKEDLPDDPRGPASWPLWFGLRGLSWVFCLLPWPVLRGLTLPLVAVFYAVTLWREERQNRRRRGVLRNMRIAFGDELDAAGRRRLCWRYCDHGALLICEFLRLPLLDRRRLPRRIDLSEVQPVLELYRQGGGLICATGHFGNWEMLGYGAGYLLPLLSLARPFPEPGLQRFFYERRRRSGARVRSKFGGLWPLRKALKRGEAVGLNMDENLRRGGLFVPFCGVLASTNPSAAILQRNTGAPIVVITCPRVGPERFRLRVWDVIQAEPERPAAEERERVTARIAAAFERGLREYPEQWLWALRRWETRPEGEREGELPERIG